MISIGHYLYIYSIITNVQALPIHMISESPICMVPIRYPLTGTSIRTLEHANDLVKSEDISEVYVLHINIFQNGENYNRYEISRAISPFFEDCNPTVVTRNGFLVEKLIATEAIDIGADIIVIGENKNPTWKRVLSRIFGNNPDVGSYLREQTPAKVTVVN
ncbi:universal stress protein [Natrinema sp. DC36]|uniref:universal stress protein n=1 Tax=Natrinema sp. DC36 TaxID=2878680 RepID=UPI001CEFD247|nr:universal stress protein [Natrinema sp. DC36]